MKHIAIFDASHAFITLRQAAYYYICFAMMLIAAILLLCRHISFSLRFYMPAAAIIFRADFLLPPRCAAPCRLCRCHYSLPLRFR